MEQDPASCSPEYYTRTTGTEQEKRYYNCKMIILVPLPNDPNITISRIVALLIQSLHSIGEKAKLQAELDDLRNSQRLNFEKRQRLVAQARNLTARATRCRQKVFLV